MRLPDTSKPASAVTENGFQRCDQVVPIDLANTTSTNALQELVLRRFGVPEPRVGIVADLVFASRRPR